MFKEDGAEDIRNDARAETWRKRQCSLNLYWRERAREVGASLWDSEEKVVRAPFMNVPG